MWNDSFFILIAVAVIGMIVQGKLKSVFAKYSRVMFAGGMTGKDVAEKMLRDNGIYDVKVTHVKGQLTDHYNPATKTVNLSDSVYNSNSVSAAAVAAHECGHAVQHAVGYAPLKLRSALVPVTQFSSQWSMMFVLGGLAMMWFSRPTAQEAAMGAVANVPWLFWVGIGMLAVAALFSIITLPVEYNASHRALAWLDNQHILNREQHAQAKEALMWAARTYLVAALSAVATIIYYLSFVRRD